MSAATASHVTTLVGPDGDAHVYTPSPADAKTVADAKLVIVNGLGFEGWLPRLVKSSGGKAPIVEATKGIKPRERMTTHACKATATATADPHAWQSVANAKIYVANIRDALIAADPAGAETYRANAEAYLAKLDALDARGARGRRANSGRAPQGDLDPRRLRLFRRRLRRRIHRAAGRLHRVRGQRPRRRRDHHARSRPRKFRRCFLENISDPRLMRRIAAETGAKVGGTLYSDSLTAEKGDAPTYIDMVRHNIKALTSALAD